MDDAKPNGGKDAPSSEWAQEYIARFKLEERLCATPKPYTAQFSHIRVAVPQPSVRRAAGRRR